MASKRQRGHFDVDGELLRVILGGGAADYTYYILAGVGVAAVVAASVLLLGRRG